MKQVLIKPGTIFLSKEYKRHEKLLAFLKRKKLGYNKFYIFDSNHNMIRKPNKTDCILLEPKKKYSGKEIVKLSLLNRLGWIEDCKDVLTVINAVRPNTVDESLTLDQLLENRFYNIRKLSDEKEYVEYIY